jgi:excisionase family DNA binding protein
MEVMLSVKGAAQQLGVSEGLVYAWTAAGALAHHRLGLPGKRGVIRIAEADLEAFLASQKREGRMELPPAPYGVRLKNLSLG